MCDLKPWINVLYQVPMALRGRVWSVEWWSVESPKPAWNHIVPGALQGL